MNKEHQEKNKKVLLISFVLVTTFMIVEFIGGLVTNSLALLSDSGHMLSDSFSLLVAFLAFQYATKEVNKNKTYGFKRFEILAALFNGVSLLVISGIILLESAKRIGTEVEINSMGMLMISILGLIINIIMAIMMYKKADVQNNLNMKGAFLHVIADMLGSISAIIASITIMLYDFIYADIIASSLVALLILRSGIKIILKSSHILMEGVPYEVSFDEVLKELNEIEGIKSMHDLHVWSLSSGENALSCHMVIDEEMELKEVQKIQEEIRDKVKKYSIIHCSIQAEVIPCSNQILCNDAKNI